MKHAEVYDKHENRKLNNKQPKKYKESIDRDARRRRVSFKNYVRELEEEFQANDLVGDEPESDLT